MLKKIALVFGVVFTLIGILGFVPGITSTDDQGMQLLFGLFMVDGLHNTIHLVSGIAGLAATTSAKYAKWYLLVFGAVYGLVTLLGFIDNTLFGIMHVNMADNLLHLVLTAGLLGSALMVKEGQGPASAPVSPVM